MEPEGKAFWISHFSWMLYLTQDQSSSYHLSLPRGSRVCRLVHEPDFWTEHLFTEEMKGGGREWRQDEYEKTMTTVTVWKIRLASHDSDIAPEASPGDWKHSQDDGFHLISVTRWRPPVWPWRVGRVMCHFSTAAAAPGGFISRRHRLPSRSLPGSWPRTFIFIIGKIARAEEAARKSRSAGLWFVRGFFFFWGTRETDGSN